MPGKLQTFAAVIELGFWGGAAEASLQMPLYRIKGFQLYFRHGLRPQFLEAS